MDVHSFAGGRGLLWSILAESERSCRLSQPDGNPLAPRGPKACVGSPRVRRCLRTGCPVSNGATAHGAAPSSTPFLPDVTPSACGSEKTGVARAGTGPVRGGVSRYLRRIVPNSKRIVSLPIPEPDGTLLDGRSHLAPVACPGLQPQKVQARPPDRLIVVSAAEKREVGKCLFGAADGGAREGMGEVRTI